MKTNKSTVNLNNIYEQFSESIIITELLCDIWLSGNKTAYLSIGREFHFQIDRSEVFFFKKAEKKSIERLSLIIFSWINNTAILNNSVAIFVKKR